MKQTFKLAKFFFIAGGSLLALSSVNAAVVFSDDFEGPEISNPTGYSLASTSRTIDTTKWVRATAGFGSDRNGLVHENENGGNTFTDPTGSQAWAGRYSTNTGLTSAFGQIGTIAVGQTITITFDAVRDGYVSNLTSETATNGNITNGTDLDVYLVLFDGAGTRNDLAPSLSIDGTSAVLARFFGNQGVNDTYQTFSFSYTVGDDVIDNNGIGSGVANTWNPGLLGQDIAVRFGIGNHAIIDNLSVSIIPEPSSALLGAIGILLLLRRRR